MICFRFNYSTYTGQSLSQWDAKFEMIVASSNHLVDKCFSKWQRTLDNYFTSNGISASLRRAALDATELFKLPEIIQTSVQEEQLNALIKVPRRTHKKSSFRV